MTDKSLPSFAEWPVLFIRGQRVILDADLARIFSVPAGRIAERVRRNRSRFPEDFLFRLTAAERDELVTACRRLRRLKFSSALPLAFTEPGVLMLAGVLDSPEAGAASVEAIRGYIRARRVAVGDPDLARELDAIESTYDAEFKPVFDAIRQLMEQAPQKPRPRIVS